VILHNLIIEGFLVLELLECFFNFLNISQILNSLFFLIFRFVISQ